MESHMFFDQGRLFFKLARNKRSINENYIINNFVKYLQGVLQGIDLDVLDCAMILWDFSVKYILKKWFQFGLFLNYFLKTSEFRIKKRLIFEENQKSIKFLVSS